MSWGGELAAAEPHMMHVAAARRGELPGLRRRPDRSRAPAACSTRCCAGHEDGRAAFELWKAAVEVGGPDNVTMALVRLGTWNRGRLGAEAASLSRLAGEEYRRYGRWSREAR